MSQLGRSMLFTLLVLPVVPAAFAGGPGRFTQKLLTAAGAGA